MIVARSVAWAALALAGALGIDLAAPATAGAAAAGDSVVLGVCEASLLPIGVVPPAGGLLPGCQRPYTLKSGVGHGTRGVYGLLDLPACVESACDGPRVRNRLRCQIVQGVACCPESLLVGSEIRTLGGARSGQFLPALAQRYWADLDQRSDICYAAYLGNGRRVIRVVVLTAPDDDRRAPRIAGFASFFLHRLPTRSRDDLVGEFLPASAP